MFSSSPRCRTSRAARLRPRPSLKASRTRSGLRIASGYSSPRMPGPLEDDGVGVLQPGQVAGPLGDLAALGHGTPPGALLDLLDCRSFGGNLGGQHLTGAHAFTASYW